LESNNQNNKRKWSEMNNENAKYPE
jgi:hypothetical protein